MQILRIILMVVTLAAGEAVGRSAWGQTFSLPRNDGVTVPVSPLPSRTSEAENVRQTTREEGQARDGEEAISGGKIPLFIDPQSIILANAWLKQQPEGKRPPILSLQISMPKYLTAWELRSYSELSGVSLEELLGQPVGAVRGKYLRTALKGLVDEKTRAPVLYFEGGNETTDRVLLPFFGPDMLNWLQEVDHALPLAASARVVYDDTTFAKRVSDEALEESRQEIERFQRGSLTHFLVFNATDENKDEVKSFLSNGKQGTYLGEVQGTGVAVINDKLSHGSLSRFCSESSGSFPPLPADFWSKIESGSEVWLHLEVYLTKQSVKEALQELPSAVRIESAGKGVIRVHATQGEADLIRSNSKFYVREVEEASKSKEASCNHADKSSGKVLQSESRCTG